MRTNYRELARLKRKEVSNRQIAVIMNLSRNTVNRITHVLVEKHLSWGEVEHLSDHELVSIFESPPAVNPRLTGDLRRTYLRFIQTRCPGH